MTTNRIVLNETSYFGFGSRSVLPTEIKARNFKKVLVVTDKDLVKFHVAAMVTAVLDEANIAYEIFSDVKQNPTVKNVQNGLAALQASGADALIGIGGGSAIDTAKAIGIIATNPEFADVVSLEGVAATHAPSLPLIALPTTAGTAAEVTINYVITDEYNRKKMVCVDPHDIPVVAIVDAELMLSMPASLTAATGMDALTHAIEGFITRGAWEMTDIFEVRAIELIAEHFEKAVKEPANQAAREGMALAQYVAGMGFSNVGLGIVHSMAHPLGAFYDIPHGVANALLLPTIMEFNAPATGEKFRTIARAMGVNAVDTLSLDEARQAAVKAVRDLALRVNIPQKLSAIGVKEADLESLSRAAFNDVCTPGNPRDVTPAEILALYRKVF